MLVALVLALAGVLLIVKREGIARGLGSWEAESVRRSSLLNVERTEREAESYSDRDGVRIQGWGVAAFGALLILGAVLAFVT